MRPLIENCLSGFDTRRFSITLDLAQTSAFYAACKSKKRTLTPVINALLILAEVETAIRLSGQHYGESRRDLELADVFPITVNVVDRVSEYDKGFSRDWVS